MLVDSLQHLNLLDIFLIDMCLEINDFSIPEVVVKELSFCL